MSATHVIRIWNGSKGILQGWLVIALLLLGSFKVAELAISITRSIP